MSACLLCVCNVVTLESFDLDSSFLVDLENVQVKLVYKGHRVKVKVIETKRSIMRILAM